VCEAAEKGLGWSDSHAGGNTRLDFGPLTGCAAELDGLRAPGRRAFGLRPPASLPLPLQPGPEFRAARRKPHLIIAFRVQWWEQREILDAVRASSHRKAMSVKPHGATHQQQGDLRKGISARGSLQGRQLRKPAKQESRQQARRPRASKIRARPLPAFKRFACFCSDPDLSNALCNPALLLKNQ